MVNIFLRRDRTRSFIDPWSRDENGDRQLTLPEGYELPRRTLNDYVLYRVVGNMPKSLIDKN